MRHGLMMTPTVLHPKSIGKITLASGDPLDRPVINPNIATAEQDRTVLKAGKICKIGSMVGTDDK